jgi:hypothetical protein
MTRRVLWGFSSIAVGVALGNATAAGLIPIGVSLPLLLASILIHMAMAEWPHD